MSGTSPYLVRRRLLETSNKPLIDRLQNDHGIPSDVAIEALLLADGDVELILAAVDGVAFDRTRFENRPKCARLLERIRRTNGVPLEVSKENAVRWRLLSGLQKNTVGLTVDLGNITLDEALTLLAERYDGDAGQLYRDHVPPKVEPHPNCRCVGPEGLP